MALETQVLVSLGSPDEVREFDRGKPELFRVSGAESAALHSSPAGNGPLASSPSPGQRAARPRISVINSRGP